MGFTFGTSPELGIDGLKGVTQVAPVTQPPVPALPSPLRPANTVVVFGDSITENNSYNTASLAANGPRGYMTWANALLGTKRMTLLNNAGVSGQATPAMLARIKRDVLDYQPHWCVVHAGINDLAGELRGAEAVISDLNTIYETLLANNIQVVATTIMGVGSTHANWSQQLHARIRYINQWIAQKASVTRGMVLCDFYGVVINPTDASANPKAGYFWDTPAVHPATLGAYFLGKALKDVLSPLLSPVDSMMASIVDDWAADAQTLTSLFGYGGYSLATLTAHNRKVGDVLTVIGAADGAFNGVRRVIEVPSTTPFVLDGGGVGAASGTISISGSVNILDEGLFQGSGGTASTGVSGTVPTGWTVERGAGTPTAVSSLTARTDGVGSDLNIVITSGANGDSIQARGPDPFTRALPGERVYAECEVSVSSATALNQLTLRLNVISGTTQNKEDGGTNDFTDAFPTESFTALLRTPSFIVPNAGLTRLRPLVVTRFSGVGGATVKIGRARIVKVR